MMELLSFNVEENKLMELFSCDVDENNVKRF